MFVLTVRIPVQAWSPVVVFFWTHALLVEKILPTSFWLARGFWLVVMLLSGSACWYLIERTRQRNPKRLWRRALLSSIVVQLLFFVMGIVLAPE